MPDEDPSVIAKLRQPVPVRALAPFVKALEIIAPGCTFTQEGDRFVFRKADSGG